MLLDNDVVTDRKARTGAFTCRFGCEKRVEHLFLHVRRNAGPVVADADFHTIAKTSCGGHQGWFIAIAVSLCPIAEIFLGAALILGIATRYAALATFVWVLV